MLIWKGEYLTLYSHIKDHYIEVKDVRMGPNRQQSNISNRIHNTVYAKSEMVYMCKYSMQRTSYEYTFLCTVYTVCIYSPVHTLYVHTYICT